MERDFPYLAALTRDEDAALLLAEVDLRSSGADLDDVLPCWSSTTNRSTGR